MSNLDTKANNFNIIINFKNNILDNSLFDKLNSYLKAKSIEYHYIGHLKEIDFDTGTFKTPHIHCLYKKDKRCRLKTELLSLTNYLFDDSKYTHLISIDKWVDYELGIQYLIHKNDYNKQKYLPSDIVSSVDGNLLETLLNANSENKLSIAYIIDLIDSCRYLCDVYSKLGLFYSYKYRSLINDIWRERKLLGIEVSKDLPF